jgi:hypothetical protein
MALLTDAYTAVPQSSPSQASRPSLARRKTIARDLTTGSRKVIANVGAGIFGRISPLNRHLPFHLLNRTCSDPSSLPS